MSAAITWALSLVLASGVLLAADAVWIDPSTEKARLLKAEGGRAVWRVSTLHPETARHRAPTFTHLFYLQRLDEKNAKLVYRLVDTAVRYAVAIREDGSLLVETRRRVHFVPAAGPAVTQDLGSLECLALYPDGLLAEDWCVRDRKQMRPAYFVPFDGTSLRVNDRVRVVESGVKSLTRQEGLGHPGEPYRIGSRFVWVADSALHTFDLKDRGRKSVKLGTELHPSYRVSAFDGSTLVCGIYAFDSATGKLLGEPDYAKRPKNVAAVFAVRNRIGYFYGSATLKATDLSSREGASVAVCDAETFTPQQDDEGMTIWDGKRWRFVPWMKELQPR
jgi:hypothetical protein